MTSSCGIGVLAINGGGDGGGVGGKTSDRMAVLELLIVGIEGGGTAGLAVVLEDAFLVPFCFPSEKSPGRL